MSTTATSTNTTVSVPSSVSSGIGSTTNFGDSITCGVGATSASGGYASLLDTAIGKTSTNSCRSGDQAADMTRVWVYPNTTPVLGQNQLYTVLIGTNDANACGISSGCIANWYDSLQASIAWLALPSGDKQAATSATSRTGSWTDDLVTGLSTTGSGSSLSFTVNQAIAGHNLYVAYRVFDSSSSNPGTASLVVDGNRVSTLSSADSNGHTIATINGTTDTIFVTTIPLGSVGTHTVTVATTGASGSVFSLQWIGVSSSHYTGNSAAPWVVIGSIPLTTLSNVNTTIATYNTQLTTLVKALVADGMQITVAPTGTALNISTDMYDGLHPNDSGHIKLAQAFAGVL